MIQHKTDWGYDAHREFVGDKVKMYNIWKHCLMFVTILLCGIVINFFIFWAIHKVKIGTTQGWVPSKDNVNIKTAIEITQKEAQKEKFRGEN